MKLDHTGRNKTGRQRPSHQHRPARVNRGFISLLRPKSRSASTNLRRCWRSVKPWGIPGNKKNENTNTTGRSMSIYRARRNGRDTMNAKRNRRKSDVIAVIKWVHKRRLVGFRVKTSETKPKIFDAHRVAVVKENEVEIFLMERVGVVI